MSLPTIPSNTPTTITTNNASVVYDKWAIPEAHVSVANGNVTLITIFKKGLVDGDGAFVVMPADPQKPISLRIPDIMTDPDVGASAATFFTALATKAMKAGTIA